MIKLIATDLDGTFFNEKSEISKRSEKALMHIADKDIIFVVASGRFYNKIDSVFAKYDINNKMIYAAHNGAWIQESKRRKKIWSKNFERKDIHDIASFIKNKYGAGLFTGNNEEAMIDENVDYMMRDLSSSGVNCKVVDNLENFDNICRVGFHYNKPIPKEMFNEISDKFSKDYEVTLSGKEWLDFMMKGVNKGYAIRKIQEIYNISADETMVFGDYYNDIGMLKRAYYSFAMEHAPEDVKKYANFIAQSNLYDGVANEILKL